MERCRMKTNRRFRNRSTSARRVYGEVGLAAGAFCFAIAVHGAFVVVPLQGAEGVPQPGAANVALQLDPQSALAAIEESHHSPFVTADRVAVAAVSSEQAEPPPTSPAMDVGS